MLLIFYKFIVFIYSNEKTKIEFFTLNKKFVLNSSKTLKYNNTIDYEKKCILKEDKNFSLKIVKRRLSSNDIIYFFEFKNNTSHDKTIKLVINNNSDIKNSHYFDELNIKRSFSNTVGYDKITNPYAYLEYESNSLLIGKDYNYNNIYQKYNNKISLSYKCSLY